MNQKILAFKPSTGSREHRTRGRRHEKVQPTQRPKGPQTADERLQWLLHWLIETSEANCDAAYYLVVEQVVKAGKVVHLAMPQSENGRYLEVCRLAGQIQMTPEIYSRLMSVMREERPAG